METLTSAMSACYGAGDLNRLAWIAGADLLIAGACAWILAQGWPRGARGVAIRVALLALALNSLREAVAPWIVPGWHLREVLTTLIGLCFLAAATLPDRRRARDAS